MSGMQTPTRPDGGRQRVTGNDITPTPTARGGDLSSPLSKKSKIFHFFGNAQPHQPKAPAHHPEQLYNRNRDWGSRAQTGGGGGRDGTRKDCSGHSIEVHRAEEVSQPVKSPSPANNYFTPNASAPSWGKIIDPSKRRRWRILQRLLEKRSPYARIDNIAWARRSYTLSYAPGFQDARTPGMGSTTKTWRWNAPSNVFGGGRACCFAYTGHAKHNATTIVDCGGGSVNGTSMVTEGIEGAELSKVGRLGVGNSEDTSSNSRMIAAKRRRSLQRQNFSVMSAWLSSSRLPCNRHSDSALGHAQTVEVTHTSKTFLDVSLERHDGGLASVFIALESLASRPFAEGGMYDNEEFLHDPVALALSLYHDGKVWRRIKRLPVLRQHEQGSQFCLHPDDSDDTAVNNPNPPDRRTCSTGDYEAGLALLDAGLAVPLFNSSRKYANNGEGTFFKHCYRGGELDDDLTMLAPREILTAAETRALTKTLGVAPNVIQTPRDVWGEINTPDKGTNRHTKSDDRRRGRGSGKGGGVDGKEEGCRALEEWVIRPVEVSRRRARAFRAVHKTAELVSTGVQADRKRRRRKIGCDDDSSGGSLVIRLAADLREVIHRVHVAFFAAARHGPLDVPTVLAEDLSIIRFASKDAHEDTSVGSSSPEFCQYGGGVDAPRRIETAGESHVQLLGYRKTASTAQHEAAECTPLERGPIQTDSWRRHMRPPGEGTKGPNLSCQLPQVLTSVEVFAEYYRLVTISSGMDFAVEAGDSELAYSSLHEASTVLLPSGCPLCRCHWQHRGDGPSTTVTDDGDLMTALAGVEATPQCNICELSASVVMQGVGLMEREKDYDSAFHYLYILLRAPSLRLSVQRPRYWRRLVTDLNHKKRPMEALKACEQALAEAECPLHRESFSKAKEEPFPRTKRDYQSTRRSENVPAEAENAEAFGVAVDPAAVLPLGEALPLLRRAIRLAIPPLRWRKRSPPQLGEACLRVMKLDLSWRRAGVAKGGSSSISRDHGSVKSAIYMHARASTAHPDVGAVRIGCAKSKEKHETPEVTHVLGMEGASSSVAPGTSLEQAVLDTMLAELGPEWTGMHAENSICLGAFALLCWDALFAPMVPTGKPLMPPAQSRAGAQPIGSIPTDSLVSGDRRLQGTRNHQDLPKEGTEGDKWLAKRSATELGKGGSAKLRRRANGSQENIERVFEESEDRPIAEEICVEQPSGSSAVEHPVKASPCRTFRDDEEAFYYPFPSPYQSEPVDLMTPAFAGRRRHLLREIYTRVEEGGADALLRRNWWRHYGKACTGLNWNLFEDGVEGWVTVTSAIGPLLLSRICRNLASNYWAWRHGLPDLFIWRKNATSHPKINPTTKSDVVAPAETKPLRSSWAPSLSDVGNDGGGDDRYTKKNIFVPQREAGCKWVEVKGPGDDLSCAQEAWIDALVGAGAEPILLRVEDSAS